MTPEPLTAASEEIARGRWPQTDNPLFRLLLRRWAAWRGGAPVPRRSAVTPAEIVPCLPQLWIFRLVDNNTGLVCALAGERLNEDWGFSIRGKTPVDLWGAELGGLVTGRLLRVALTPGIAIGRSGVTPRPDPVGPLYAERLMLPLCDDAGAPYGAMGLTVFHRHQLIDGPQVVPMSAKAWMHPCADLPDEPPPQD